MGSPSTRSAITVLLIAASFSAGWWYHARQPGQSSPLAALAGTFSTKKTALPDTRDHHEKMAERLRALLAKSRTYAEQNEGRFPRPLNALVPDYCSDDEFRALQYQDAITGNIGGWGIFGAPKLSDPARTLAVISGIVQGTAFRVVGYTSGEAEVVPETEFQKMLAEARVRR